MEGILIFTSVLFIVFGILQIILFFKIWIMTNKVSAIEEKLNEKKGYYYYMMSGEKEKAYNFLKEELTHKLIRFKKDSYDRNEFLRLSDKTIKEYLHFIGYTGFELPEHLQNGEAFYKYYNKIANWYSN
ncbi:MAG: hypothetical protein LBU44_05295 [Mediterranea sp.]|jgi:hypothetical protein|nr:hypothetical protein [Mediterranea sp.]